MGAPPPDMATQRRSRLPSLGLGLGLGQGLGLGLGLGFP